MKKAIIYTNNGIKLCKLSLLNTQDGLRLYAKSSVLERFFKRFGKDISAGEDHNGNWYYNTPKSSDVNWNRDISCIDSKDNNYTFNYNYVFKWNNDRSLWHDVSNESINLSWLCTVGLSKGIEVNLDSKIYTIADRHRYVDNASLIIKKLYLDYIKDTSDSIELKIKREIRS